MKSFIKLYSIIFITFVFVAGLHPVHVYAAGSVAPPYELLAPIPLGSSAPSTTTNVNDYIKNVVKLIIGLAGGLAILRIIMGGIKYMTSEAISGKSDARQTIQDAIVGLLLAICAYVILFTVNPDLVSFKFDISGVRVGPPISSDLGSTPPATTVTGGAAGTCDANNSCDYNTPAAMGEWGSCGPNCIPITNPNVKLKGCAGASGTSPSNCQASAPLVAELSKLAVLEKDPWQVTEAWPPTYKLHKSECHNPTPLAGTCVDVALEPGNNASPTNTQIYNFLSDIKNSGSSSFQYEVTTQARLDALTSDPKLKGFKIVLTNGTGEHAHMNQ